MARLLGNQGFIMNQSNNNSYIRWYSRGKNDVGPLVRFSISGGNPHLHINLKVFFAFTQTNGNDFHTAGTTYMGLYCDTGGNVYFGYNAGWQSGAGFEKGFSTSNRQADLWIMSPSNGGWPGRSSICCEIFCDRWDYLSLSNL
jgi:hypothetical protein